MYNHMLEHRYHTTVMGVMHWAENELAHIGRIVAIEDPDIQYAYAMSTVNGMIHLHNAISEMIADNKYEHTKPDLELLLAQVVRATKHLIKDYDVNLKSIKDFNTRGVLGSLNYLTSKNNTPNTKKNKKGGRRQYTMKGG